MRAVQTAEIIASEYDCEVVTVGALAPDEDPAKTLTWIGTQRADGTVAVVGHEPHLSALVSYMLAGKRTAFIELKKGGACLLEVAAFTPGSSTLKWLLTRRELVRLGE